MSFCFLAATIVDKNAKKFFLFDIMMHERHYGSREGPTEIKVLLSKINFGCVNYTFVIENKLLESKLKLYH